MTIALLVVPVINFSIVQVFPWLLIEIEVHGIMWMFAVSCAIGVVIITIFLPETKGKNLNKILS